MAEKDMNQEFRLKKIEEIRNYFIKEINQNKLMSKKHKKLYRVLNYIDHLLIVISTITGCVSISVFCWYSYRNYEFCSWIKNLCNNCSK